MWDGINKLHVRPKAGHKSQLLSIYIKLQVVTSQVVQSTEATKKRRKRREDAVIDHLRTRAHWLLHKTQPVRWLLPIL